MTGWECTISNFFTIIINLIFANLNIFLTEPDWYVLVQEVIPFNYLNPGFENEVSHSQEGLRLHAKLGSKQLVGVRTLTC